MYISVCLILVNSIQSLTLLHFILIASLIAVLLIIIVNTVSNIFMAVNSQCNLYQLIAVNRQYILYYLMAALIYGTVVS